MVLLKTFFQGPPTPNTSQTCPTQQQPPAPSSSSKPLPSDEAVSTVDGGATQSSSDVAGAKMADPPPPANEPAVQMPKVIEHPGVSALKKSAMPSSPITGPGFVFARSFVLSQEFFPPIK